MKYCQSHITFVMGLSNVLQEAWIGPLGPIIVDFCCLHDSQFPFHTWNFSSIRNCVLLVIPGSYY